MVVQREGAYWVARGNGPIRPIIVEGSSPTQAREDWIKLYRKQQVESLTTRIMEEEANGSSNQD